MHKTTINHLPDELLVEIFDLYRQDIAQTYPLSLNEWSITLDWFELIHVCKRWRTIMFASASWLGLCLVLTPEKGGNIKTILSRHFPPLPIEIHYCRPVKTKDIGRMLAALKRPDRIRKISFLGSAADLNKLFKATKGTFPALETLGDQNRKELKIPATFLKGSGLRLRSLKLHRISLPSASLSRLLSSAPALTNFYLVIDTDISQPPAMSFLLSHLQGLPCLHHLYLEIDGIISARRDRRISPVFRTDDLPLSWPQHILERPFGPGLRPRPCRRLTFISVIRLCLIFRTSPGLSKI